MHQRRWHLWLGGILLLLLVGSAVTYFWPRCPIRYDHFDKISDDMTLAQVEALIGCPPGDYRSGEIEYKFEDNNFPPLSDTEARWQGDQGDIIVFRDDMERIVAKTWIKGELEPSMKSFMIWGIERARRK